MTSLSWSVVVPVYNGRRFLGPTLTSILESSCTPENLIVVDDGSTDGSADFVEQSFRGVRVLRGRNEGGAAARHRGLHAVKTDYFCFMDQDDLYRPAGIHALLAAAAARPDADAVIGGHRSVLEGADPQRSMDIGSAYRPRDEYWVRRPGIWKTSILDVHLQFVPLACWLTKAPVAQRVFDNPELEQQLRAMALHDYGYSAWLAAISQSLYRIPDIVLYYRIRRDRFYPRQGDPGTVLQGTLDRIWSGRMGEAGALRLRRLIRDFRTADYRYATGSHLAALTLYLRFAVQYPRALCVSPQVRRALVVRAASSLKRMVRQSSGHPNTSCGPEQS